MSPSGHARTWLEFIQCWRRTKRNASRGFFAGAMDGSQIHGVMAISPIELIERGGGAAAILQHLVGWREEVEIRHGQQVRERDINVGGGMAGDFSQSARKCSCNVMVS